MNTRNLLFYRNNILSPHLSISFRALPLPACLPVSGEKFPSCESFSQFCPITKSQSTSDSSGSHFIYFLFLFSGSQTSSCSLLVLTSALSSSVLRAKSFRLSGKEREHEGVWWNKMQTFLAGRLEWRPCLRETKPTKLSVFLIHLLKHSIHYGGMSYNK